MRRFTGPGSIHFAGPFGTDDQKGPKKRPFEDGLQHPFMVFLGMVYCCGAHITRFVKKNVTFDFKSHETCQGDPAKSPQAIGSSMWACTLLQPCA